MRFGVDGTLRRRDDGVPAAREAPEGRPAGRGPACRSARNASRPAPMADELRRFSLVKGADPDLVGVTTWAQPWVPLWLEWELEVAGLDPPDARRLAARRRRAASGGRRRDAAVDPAGATRTVVGRSLLDLGRRHHDPVRGARPPRGRGRPRRGRARARLSEETEAALRTLADACAQVDVSTAALDGLHRAAARASPGHRRRSSAPSAPDGGPSTRPRTGRRPSCSPAGSAWSGPGWSTRSDGCSTCRSTPSRYRTRYAVARRRRARWPCRRGCCVRRAGSSAWSTRRPLSAAEGTEARVDQVDPTLQVSPVCGFLLPDHLDESLEVLGADGSPLGELLHEPVSGGVMWEIAPGREGPPDSGPGFGLTDRAATPRPARRRCGRRRRRRARRVARGEVARRTSPRCRRCSARSTRRCGRSTPSPSFGSEHVAGLVGRPIAVVRAQLRLELRPPDDVDLVRPGRGPRSGRRPPTAASRRRASRCASAS